jgi:hypothetical protein
MARTQVHDTVLGELEGLGHFPSDVNKTYATLQSSFFTVLASDLGVKPHEAFEQYRLRIDDGGAAEGAGLYQDGAGPFGPVFKEHSGDPAAAVARLMQERTGEVPGALYHPEIGNIDLVWGKEGDPEQGFKGGYGLAKIAAKHPEVMGELQEILSGMSILKRGGNRVLLESSDHKAAVSLDWLGDEKKWLLSAYEKNKRSETDTTIHAIRDAEKGASLSLAPDESITTDINNFKQAKRGQYIPEEQRIRLLEKADLSTFVHESGHFFLDTYARIASGENAPAKVRRMAHPKRRIGSRRQSGSDRRS